MVLKGKHPGYRWMGAAIGTAGVAIALTPHLDAWQHASQLYGTAMLGIASGLAAALCAAISIVQVRSLAATEPPAAIAFHYTLMSGMLGMPQPVRFRRETGHDYRRRRGSVRLTIATGPGKPDSRFFFMEAVGFRIGAHHRVLPTMRAYLLKPHTGDIR